MRPIPAFLSPYYLFFAMLSLLIGWWLVMRIRKATGVWRLRYFAFPRPWLKFLHENVPLYTRLPWELRAPYQDKVLQFMEEFIKRQTGATKPRDNTMFRELNDPDRESVNEILKSIGVHYKEVF